VDFPRPARNFRPARVLVVDDEPLIRWSLAETLGARGYDVVEAADGASALRMFALEASRADVVLLDVRLPDCDDLRLVSAIRLLSPKVPVIVMTAYGSEELVEAARRDGVFAVLIKPFEMADIAGLVDRALATRVH
jgi:DNA-binding NtrC family response regulator